MVGSSLHDMTDISLTGYANTLVKYNNMGNSNTALLPKYRYQLICIVCRFLSKLSLQCHFFVDSQSLLNTK